VQTWSPARAAGVRGGLTWKVRVLRSPGCSKKRSGMSGNQSGLTLPWTSSSNTDGRSPLFITAADRLSVSPGSSARSRLCSIRTTTSSTRSTIGLGSRALGTGSVSSWSSEGLRSATASASPSISTTCQLASWAGNCGCWRADGSPCSPGPPSSSGPSRLGMRPHCSLSMAHIVSDLDRSLSSYPQLADSAGANVLHAQLQDQTKKGTSWVQRSYLV